MAVMVAFPGETAFTFPSWSTVATLESLVITRVMGEANRRKAELGLVDLKNFPLLMHIVEILDKGMADADLPWEAFTFENFR